MSLNIDLTMSYVSPSGRYTLNYPNRWEVESDEDCVTFSKIRNGVGALQISAYETDIPRSAEDSLREHFEDEKVVAEISAQIADDSSQTATGYYEKEGLYSKVWFVTNDNCLLFITYNCDSKSKTIETEDVNSIVESVRLNT
ncbi:MAG: DUF3805 domain-containing protein [Pyrinomonadaceae bacterium]